MRLIPPIYVKPFVRRQKNDAADAEAITEAASRPTMRFVTLKAEEQQARSMIFRTCDLLVRQRWQAAPHDNWPFKATLEEITAPGIGVARLEELLRNLESGQKVTKDVKSR